jgi:hypothetical protein
MRTALLAIAVAVLLALVGAPAAQARSSYCSPTGDYCKAVIKQHGRWVVDLRTAALYGPGRAYRLCVDPPGAAETCKTFRLRRTAAGVYLSRVTWSRHFPNAGRGTYRVRFDHGGITYGPRLDFRR